MYGLCKSIFNVELFIYCKNAENTGSPVIQTTFT